MSAGNHTKTTEDMKKAVEFLHHELAGVRTGKASPSLVEGIDIHVSIYGSSMKLKQLAMISTPDSRMILVQPFDPATAQDIERGLRESKLGINPSAEGKNIRLPIPELTGERRKELVKVVKRMSEESRVRVRNIRREAIDTLKKDQKDGVISEDDLHRGEKEVQEMTDRYIKEIDTHLSNKETEIMTL